MALRYWCELRVTADKQLGQLDTTMILSVDVGDEVWNAAKQL